MKKMSMPSIGALCKSISISGLLLFIFYIFFFDTNHHQSPSSLFETVKPKWATSTPNLKNTISPTNISHIVFGIVGSMNTWKYKRSYIESWWRPNVSRGYIFLDREPTQEFLPWSLASPPFRVNEDITKLKVYPQMVRPFQVRILRTVLETFRQGDKNVRWYVMADDDTILFLENLVEVLNKYDHTKSYYIGTNSECIKSNTDFSFDMAFGGAAYALSYNLMETLATKLDGCIERYHHLWVSDYMLHSCLADLGVPLTLQKGFHQIDLHDDISGLLSAHPQTPFLSLHHLDTIDPIFPSMNRSESINHLMKAAKVDESRLLQQTICYYRPNNWSFSISWGYSAHIYEDIFPRSYLRRPLETFKPWKNERPPLYMFNTRWPYNNIPCEAPHLFFFHSIHYFTKGDQVLTTYVRSSPRDLPVCSSNANQSAEAIFKILVFSPATTHLEVGGRDCCDVVHRAHMNTTEIRYRSCTKDEVIA